MTNSTRKFKVIWTYVIALYVLFAYLGLVYQAHGTLIPDELLVNYGANYAKDIYDGAFWGVIFNSLLHNSFSLFACNLLFFLVAGYQIEKRNGVQFLLFFGLSSSILTSCCELAFSGDPGVGLTGVNFALLGYVLVSTDIVWKNAWVRSIPWFFVGVVLFLCADQIIQNDFKIAVFSILSGIVFGVIIGFTKRINWLFYSLQFFFLVFSIVSLFYNPYSSEWQTVQGYRLQSAGKDDLAKIHYDEALRLAPDNVAARNNLKLIKINKLMDRAYALHLKKDYTSARYVYIQILNIDERNAWAKENLANLP